jgi:hypothetical protein
MRFYKTTVIFCLFIIAMMTTVSPVILLLYGGYIEALGSVAVGGWCFGILIGGIHEVRHSK